MALRLPTHLESTPHHQHPHRASPPGLAISPHLNADPSKGRTTLLPTSSPSLESHDSAWHCSPPRRSGVSHAPLKNGNLTLQNDSMSTDIPVVAPMNRTARGLATPFDIDDFDMTTPLYPTPPSSPSLTFSSAASLRLKSCQSTSTTSAWDGVVAAPTPSPPPSYCSRPRIWEQMAFSKWQLGLLSPRRRREATAWCCGEGVVRRGDERNVTVSKPRLRRGGWCCGSPDLPEPGEKCDVEIIQKTELNHGNNTDDVEIAVDDIGVDAVEEGEVDVVEVEGGEFNASQIRSGAPRRTFRPESELFGPGSSPCLTRPALLSSHKQGCMRAELVPDTAIMTQDQEAKMASRKQSRVLSWLDTLDIAPSSSPSQTSLPNLSHANAIIKRKLHTCVTASDPDVAMQVETQPGNHQPQKKRSRRG